MPSAPPLILAVEGIVGSGKTSFLSAVRNSFLATKYAIYVVESPLERWQDVEGTNLLKLYHTDPVRHTFSFQSWCLSTRHDSLMTHLRTQIDPADHRPVITFVERACMTDVDCFCATLCARGMLNAWEMELLRTQCRQLTRMLPHPNGVIMMNTPVDISMRCVNIRRREGESLGVTQDFQQDLLESYRKWLRTTHIPRIHVDTVAAFHHQPASYEAVVDVMQEVDDFIRRLHAQAGSTVAFIQNAMGYGVLSDDESEGDE